MTMRPLRWRQMVQLVLVCGFMWLLIILYTHTSVKTSIDSVWYSVMKHSLDDERLRELMAPLSNQEGNISVRNPLESLVLQNEGMLNFYYLPVRKSHILYTEITSANRDTSYPLAPDFTFHIEYNKNDVVIYEDYGAGCVYRIYLFPALPQDTTKLHQLTPIDLRNSYISLIVDERTFWFSLQQVMEGREWPFVTPINTQHPRPASGVGSYTPFCYQNQMKISYQHSENFPPNLFEDMINCSKNDLLCSTHIYSAVSRHKFPPHTKVPSFAIHSFGKHKKAMENAAHMLNKPELYGPDAGERCLLDCVEMCAECKHTLFRAQRAGVISAIKMRVFETATSRPLPNWNSIFVTMHFDGAAEPQVNSVPLGSLFAATGSMNEFKGASMGRRKRTCSYSDGLLDLPATTMTSYIYFPMPFWRSARITLEGSTAVDTSLLVCYKVTEVENYYKEEDTAYFHAHKSFYSSSVEGWSNILQEENVWGQIVGLQMEVEELKAQRNVPLNERWAALQADMILYIDGAQSASMLGTGLEDYFSYAHGFALAENTSYSFVGVYHASPRRKEPLTWHSYRLHILDPIPFQKSVHFISEGTKSGWFKPEKALDWEEYHDKQTEKESTISYLVLYYARRQAGGTISDQLDIGNSNSEHNHDFTTKPSSQSKPEIFSVEGRRYLGNSLKNVTYNKVGRQFKSGDSLSFTMKIFSPNRGVILRREFYSPPKLWNARADVYLDDQYLGQWFVAMGTLVEEYSLQQEDFPIGQDLTNHKTDLKIKIVPHSPWYDILYQVLVIH